MIVTFFVGFSLFLVLGLWVNHNKSKKQALPTWNQVAGKLRPVPSEGILTLAMEQLRPDSSPKRRNYHQIWHLVGGAKGLIRMSENSKIFIELVSYEAITNLADGDIVADRMRQDGLALRRACLGLGIAAMFGYGRSRMSAYAQDAASSYYLMRERLLTLYRHTQDPIYPLLEAALQTEMQKL